MMIWDCQRFQFFLHWTNLGTHSLVRPPLLFLLSFQFFAISDGPTINQTNCNVVDGIDLDEIKEFAKAFKLRRLSLGLTQTQVGQALSVTEGPAYSQSAICRWAVYFFLSAVYISFIVFYLFNRISVYVWCKLCVLFYSFTSRALECDICDVIKIDSIWMRRENFFWNNAFFLWYIYLTH